MAVGPGADAVFCIGREVVRAEETTISPVRWVHGTVGKVTIARCGTHITINEGAQVLCELMRDQSNLASCFCTRGHHQSYRKANKYR